MNLQRTIELEALRLLKQVAPYRMLERAITNQLLVNIQPRPEETEIIDALNALKSDKRIIGIRTADGVKYSITHVGKADLFEAENV